MHKSAEFMKGYRSALDDIASWVDINYFLADSCNYDDGIYVVSYDALLNYFLINNDS